MEFDKALRLAVILSWDDILKVPNSSSVRLEYQQEAGTSLDSLSVWSDRPKGNQFLICNCRTTTTSAHPAGTRFANGYHSDRLAQNLDFIMKNQNEFTYPADAGRNGLVLIYPPSGEDRTEAAAWMSGIQSSSAVEKALAVASR
jgi:hypothetical protein